MLKFTHAVQASLVQQLRLVSLLGPVFWIWVFPMPTDPEKVFPLRIVLLLACLFWLVMCQLSALVIATIQIDKKGGLAPANTHKGAKS
jgi:hypothetical protein